MQTSTHTPAEPALILALSIQGSADACSVSKQTIYRLLKAGTLTGSNMLGKTVIEVEEIKRFLAANRVQAKQ